MTGTALTSGGVVGEGAQEPDAGQEAGPLGRVERHLRRRRGRGGHAVDRGGVLRDEAVRAGEEVAERSAVDGVVAAAGRFLFSYRSSYPA